MKIKSYSAHDNPQRRSSLSSYIRKKRDGPSSSPLRSSYAASDSSTSSKLSTPHKRELSASAAAIQKTRPTSSAKSRAQYFKRRADAEALQPSIILENVVSKPKRRHVKRDSIQSSNPQWTLGSGNWWSWITTITASSTQPEDESPTPVSNEVDSSAGPEEASAAEDHGTSTVTEANSSDSAGSTTELEETNLTHEESKEGTPIAGPSNLAGWDESDDTEPSPTHIHESSSSSYISLHILSVKRPDPSRTTLATTPDHSSIDVARPVGSGSSALGIITSFAEDFVQTVRLFKDACPGVEQESDWTDTESDDEGTPYAPLHRSLPSTTPQPGSSTPTRPRLLSMWHLKHSRWRGDSSLGDEMAFRHWEDSCPNIHAVMMHAERVERKWLGPLPSKVWSDEDGEDLPGGAVEMTPDADTTEDSVGWRRFLAQTVGGRSSRDENSDAGSYDD